jgi:AcrR family transcriptional regulator
MEARAQSAKATRERILDAAIELHRVRLRNDIRLQDITALAEVSEMTVLRIFGSKFNLLQLALDRARDDIVAQRQEATPGDVAGSISVLFEHYEQVGDLVLGNLALESSDPAVRQIVRMGREDHRQWIERQFGPQLEGRPDQERADLVDGLIVACDVYVWKRLRRDMDRSRQSSIQTIQRLVEGLLGANTSEPS